MAKNKLISNTTDVNEESLVANATLDSSVVKEDIEIGMNKPEVEEPTPEITDVEEVEEVVEEDKVVPISSANTKEKPILDLDLTATHRTKVRIDGDNSKIVELNLSDMLILTRLDEQYKKLQTYLNEAQTVAQNSENDEDALIELSYELKKIDGKMRECIDAIFDYPVCAVCAPDGSMYDPFGGSYRFEHIIEGLSKFYENNMNSEYKKMAAKVNRKAQKYIGR